MPATLADIRVKVRRLTRTPSATQMTDANIDNYINDFLVYDLPEHLRLFNQETTLTWYTSPNVDTYPTDISVTNVNNPLYNFANKYVTTDQPMYIAGYEALYTQSRTQFFRLFPKACALETVGTGNGVLLGFSGTLINIPFLQNNVTFASIDSNNLGIVIKDVPNPNNSALGDLLDANDVGIPNPTVLGSINYLTGVWNINFVIAPGVNQNITAEYVPYVASRPTSILYYDDTFTVRPVPDKPYAIQMQVFAIPNLMAGDNSLPPLDQWWQYIAYGAAKKIFEDRMDNESVAAIMPEYLKQEMLVQRRTLVQRATQRAASIYSIQNDLNYSWGNSYPGAF